MNNGTLLAVKIKDRKVFQMLSSVHSINEVEIRRNHHGTGLPITKPEIVHEYNKYVGAVGRCDQMVAYSCFRRCTMKWWKRVFFDLYSLSILNILNSYILYKERTRSPVLQRVFRRELVCSCGISPTSTPRGRPRRSVGCLTPLQAGSHFPEKIQGTGKKTNITHCLVSLQEWERRERGQGGSLVSNAVFAKWHFAFKTVFNFITLCRTMLLPMFGGKIP